MPHLPPSDFSPVEPKPKYGHLSELHPGFAPMKQQVDEQFASLWAIEDLGEFRKAWASFPVALFEDSPEVDKDFTVSHQHVPVRDGTQVEIRIYKPVEPKENAVLFYVTHGGGWVIGGHDIEETMNRQVATDCKAVVVSVDYRMAPEFRYPYAVNDSFDVLKWCKQNAATLGVNPETIVVAGGSAGGNLAAALALKARDEGLTGIVGQVLNIPATCHPAHFPADEYEYGSFAQNKNASIIDVPKMLWFWEQYVPSAEQEKGKEAYASPLLAADLGGLPPALIQVAGYDPLRDEGLAYGEALEAAGVRVRVEAFKGLPHAFVFFTHLKEAREYIQNVVDFVNDLQNQSGSK